MHHHRRIRVLATCGLAFAAALVAGCSGNGMDGSDEGSSDSADVQESAGAPATTVVGTDADGAGGGEGALTATPAVAVAAADRQQIFTASVDLGVDQLDVAVREAAAAVDALGGFTATEDVALAGSAHATIVYRVPAEQFRPAMAALSKIGDLRQQQVDSSDVTSQYADLDSRVTTLRTSIGRLQGFLNETTDVNQIASLEGELTRREAELESIEAQRRALADQVALSTITVSFDATSAAPATTADRPGFAGGLDAGRDLLAGLVSVGLATFGFLLPFLPFVVVLVAVAWWWRRRTRRSGGTTPGERQPLAG